MQRWAVPLKVGLSIKVWDGCAVVFCALSGQTHMLNGLACEVLQLLEEAPATASNLVSTIMGNFVVEDKLSLESQVSTLLAEFDGLGLIELIECEN